MYEARNWVACHLTLLLTSHKSHSIKQADLMCDT